MKSNPECWKDGFKDGIPICPVSYTHLDVYKRQVKGEQAAFHMGDSWELD